MRAVDALPLRRPPARQRNSGEIPVPAGPTRWPEPPAEPSRWPAPEDPDGGRHRRDLRDEDLPPEPSNRRRKGPGFRVGGRGMPLWKEVPLLLVIAFVLAMVVKTFVIQAYLIPSGSMEQTLLIRDRVLVNKFVYDFRDPRRGDVVVFLGTDSWAPETDVKTPDGFAGIIQRSIGSLIGSSPPDEKDFIKRVIGVGGDTVQCCDREGRVQVNGVSLNEPYVYDDTPLAERSFGPVKVPKGRLFMLGDHRGDSADSRVYLGDKYRGTIPVKAVIGQAYATVWPLDRWSLVEAPTYPDVPVSLPPAGSVAPPADRARDNVGGFDHVR
jgi:signal peptidase I